MLDHTIRYPDDQVEDWELRPGDPEGSGKDFTKRFPDLHSEDVAAALEKRPQVLSHVSAAQCC